MVGWEAAELGSVKVKASVKTQTMIRKIDVTQDIQVMSITLWLLPTGWDWESGGAYEMLACFSSQDSDSTKQKKKKKKIKVEMVSE